MEHSCTEQDPFARVVELERKLEELRTLVREYEKKISLYRETVEILQDRHQRGYE